MVYNDLIVSGKLFGYLADIDTHIQNILEPLVTQMAEKEGINEHLKSQDQLAWSRTMDTICSSFSIFNKD